MSFVQGGNLKEQGQHPEKKKKQKESAAIGESSFDSEVTIFFQLFSFWEILILQYLSNKSTFYTLTSSS